MINFQLPSGCRRRTSIENLVWPKAGNQGQQTKPCSDIEEHRVREQIQRKHAIKDVGHLSLLHVAVGGGCRFLRTTPVLTRAQIGRVPIPPIMRAVRLLVVAVVLLRLVKEFC